MPFQEPSENESEEEEDGYDEKVGGSDTFYTAKKI